MLVTSFKTFITSQQLLAPGQHTLLAVSGGVDSIVLTHLFAQAELPFGIAHAHFGLRGAASDADAELVRQLAADYGVPFHEAHFQPQACAQEQGVSLQMAARSLRYDWFQELLQAGPWDQLATAHHADDNVETMLLNLIRGTGVAGLRGILPKQKRLIRPLLFATKKEIYTYAQQEGLNWREDASNASLSYRRNQVRHQLVPLLEGLNPNLAHTFARTSQRMGQIADCFATEVQALRTQVRHEGALQHIPTTALATKSWAAVTLHALLEYTGATFEQVRQLWSGTGQSGKQLLTNTHSIVQDRAQWVVSARRLTSTAPPHALQLDTPLALPGGTLTATLQPRQGHVVSPNPCMAALDAAALQWPLTVRSWQPGDVFFPLGMSRRKKVSNFLVDQKVPLPQKQQTYVAINGVDIVWVVTHRLDNRYKITRSTQQLAVLKWTPG